jgi:chorismate-pyruvate lyase
MNLIHATTGLPSPAVHRISAHDIPIPHRSLLVHDDNMTLILERYFRSRLRLCILKSSLKAEWYFRRVLLEVEASSRPAELAAVRLRLRALPDTVCTDILLERAPLGRIFKKWNVEVRSEPRFYFELQPNPEMIRTLCMPEPETAYGRQTEVIYRGSAIGSIVEILGKLS